MKKRAVCITVFVLLTSVLTGYGLWQVQPAHAAKATVLTLTLAPAEGGPHHKAGLDFARMVKERTNGQYEVKVYCNSSLASGNQLGAMEMVQNGSISCGFLSPPVQAAMEPNLNAICIPWLWKNEAQIDEHLKVGSPIHKEWNRIMNRIGFEIVGYAENGFHDLSNSVREVRSPADLKGLKIRVLGSRMLLDVFSALGANPVDLNFGELFTALQQKTVDGQENSLGTIIIPMRFYEVQKFITRWGYIYEPHPLYFNKALWDSFTPETQKILLECAEEACNLQRKYGREGTKAGEKICEDAGIKITYPTEEELKVFRDIAKPVVEKYLPQFDQDLVKALMTATGYND